MAKLGYLAPPTGAGARKAWSGAESSHDYFAHREPYFFDYVEHLLIAHYGANEVRRGGLQVHTTLSPELQRVGRAAIAEALYEPTDPASAFVSIDPRNGDVRAMVNSTDYADDQFNLAAQGHRQPGSTFKAFVLTTAIKQGIDPYSTYYESKPLDLNLPEWGHWEVHTADEGYQGTINLQQATVTSDNTVFAQLDLDVGPENVAATAKSMGITTHLQGLPAEGIGGLKYGVSPLELSDAYATLASGGIRHRPVAIAKVVRPGGKVEHPQGPQPKRVLSPAVAWQVTRLLHDNITEGTGTAAYTGCVGQAGKTGTTDNETDAWFSGYQPNLATAVWVGYPRIERDLDDRRPRDHRLRRHLPGRNLALRLRERGGPVRRIRRTRRRDRMGAGIRRVHRRGAGDRGRENEERRQRRGRRSGRRTAGPGHGRRLRPERLRPRRRPGTGPASRPRCRPRTAAPNRASAAATGRARHGSGASTRGLPTA